MPDILAPDLCIIGAGSGGLEAAAAARKLGARVVLVEKAKLGGGQFAGPLAAKALSGSGRMAHMMRTSARFGVVIEDVRANFARIRDHIASLVDAMATEHSIERVRALGVEVISAEAVFIDKRTLRAGETLVRARRFIIATGAIPNIPAIPGLDTVPYFTTETIFSNTRRPAHLLVIGGGAIGLEIAQAYRRLGAEVTVVDRGPMLRHSDPELADIALRRLTEEGVSLRPSAEVAELAVGENGIFAKFSHGEGEAAESQTIVVSHVLVATGRIPNLAGLDLEKARVAYSKAEPKVLALQKGIRTSNRRVLAIGDAAGGLHYGHIAAHQAELAVNLALLGRDAATATAPIAYAAFTDPEIAEVGLTEAEARERLKDRFKVVRSPFSENHRAQAERTSYGIVKLVCDRSGRILGAGIVGPQAGELIALFALAIANSMAVSHLRSFIVPYPTLGGILRQLFDEFEREAAPNETLRRRMAFIRRLP